jgi:hypothetical protein
VELLDPSESLKKFCLEINFKLSGTEKIRLNRLVQIRLFTPYTTRTMKRRRKLRIGWTL